MSDIPKAREMLASIARKLEHQQVSSITAARLIRMSLELMTRESPVRKAPTRPRFISRKLKADVIAYAAAHPDAHQVDIGQVFDLNPGRVSEILTGKR